MDRKKLLSLLNQQKNPDNIVVQSNSIGKNDVDEEETPKMRLNGIIYNMNKKQTKTEKSDSIKQLKNFLNEQFSYKNDIEEDFF